MDRRDFLKTAAMAGVTHTSSSAAASATLFPLDLPSSEWTQFRAAGYPGDVTGVIYRRATPATNGMPLGGVDTGCVDLETSGMWGYSTLFNSHVPRRGPINAAAFGLSVGGKTWVLCDPSQAKRYDTTDGRMPEDTPPEAPRLEGLETALEIHYWGHYPVVDMEFITSAPVSVGIRAWSPFLPGDVTASMIPGIVSEVHLRNLSGETQSGSFALNFPGPTKKEAATGAFRREEVHGPVEGVQVSSASGTRTPIAAARASYVLGVFGKEKVRFGGALDVGGWNWGQLSESPWARIHEALPRAGEGHGGASATVDFTLAPGQERIVRFVLAWHSPMWRGGGTLSSKDGNWFVHMYAIRHRSAREAALKLARDHASLLARTLAWQAEIYGDKSLPGWLQDSLINNLHLITETGMWAAAEVPLPEWVRQEDGLFGMNECPRGCPQIECIPCSFYGNIPVVYFFKELALSTLRGYKGYQYTEGAAPWIFGGVTGDTPPVDFAQPTRGYQITLNGLCYAAMVNRFALCWGGREFNREFYESVKRNAIYTFNLRPDYELGDRVISMPTGNEGTEWFEAPEPGWFGLVAHVGGLHLAQYRIVERMAVQAGDQKFAAECRKWIEEGTKSLEEKLWTGGYYLTFWEPETGRKSDLVFGYQLDGEWVADFHGLPGVFRKDRVDKTLATIKRTNIALSKSGAVNYAHANGSPAKVGGYGTYSYFPPEVLLLAMNYMYEGQRAFGIDLARRCWENITCKWRYTWDMPNIMRGDKDTGERTYGHDYYQDMMLWALPAAMAGQPMNGPLASGGLVDRVLRAARGK